MKLRRFTFNPSRTKPRTAADKRARRLMGIQFARLRREIRQERKAKS